MSEPTECVTPWYIDGQCHCRFCDPGRMNDETVEDHPLDCCCIFCIPGA